MIGVTQVLAVLALTNFLWFALGVWAVFRKDGEPSRGLSAIGLGALASAVVIVYALLTTPDVALWRQALAGGVWVGTLAGFAWCIRTTQERQLSIAFSPDLPQFLHHTGPYARVRHPFYTVYLSSYVAGFIATGAWYVGLAVVVMFGVYLWAARTEEAKFAASDIADQYEAYRARTGMFFPRLLPTSPPKQDVPG